MTIIKDSKYGSARLVLSIEQVCGAIVMIGGMFISCKGGTAGVVAGLGTILGGLVIISMAQVLEAVLDTADNTRRSKELLQRALLGKGEEE